MLDRLGTDNARFRAQARALLDGLTRTLEAPCPDCKLQGATSDPDQCPRKGCAWRGRSELADWVQLQERDLASLREEVHRLRTLLHELEQHS